MMQSCWIIPEPVATALHRIDWAPGSPQLCKQGGLHILSQLNIRLGRVDSQRFLCGDFFPTLHKPFNGRVRSRPRVAFQRARMAALFSDSRRMSTLWADVVGDE